MRNLIARVLLSACILLLLAACGGGEEQPAEEAVPETAPPVAGLGAAAILEAKSGSDVSGKVTFDTVGGEVTMTVKVYDAPVGSHAVHLHEVGDCSADDGTSAGGHWNPSGAEHGRWGEGSYHRGDIGNMVVGEDGSGELTLTTSEWTVGGSQETNIVGRAVIVHAAEDDFTTQPTGAAGGRIACGVIRVAG